MYGKSQRLVMLRYIAVAIVTLLPVHGGKNRNTSYSVDMIVGAPIPFGFGVFATQNGWINTRYSNVDREESPVSYWLYVALHLHLRLRQACSHGVFSLLYAQCSDLLRCGVYGHWRQLRSLVSEPTFSSNPVIYGICSVGIFVTDFADSKEMALNLCQNFVFCCGRCIGQEVTQRQ